MIQLLVLTIVYIIMLLLSLKLFCDNNQITPQSMFIAGFLIQVFFSFGWVKKWDLYLDWTTVFALIVGCTLFVITSWMVGALCRKIRIKRKNHVIRPFDSPIRVGVVKLVLFSLFQLVIVVLVVRRLRDMGTGSLSSLIWRYYINIHNGIKFKEISGWLARCRRISISSGYVWIYILIHSMVFKYKTPRTWLIVNIILSAICASILGSRGDVITMAVAAVVYLYVFFQLKYNWKYKLEAKTAAKILAVVFVIVLSFQLFGNILGRSDNKNAAHYIAVYFSAELKNFDTFVRNGEMGIGNTPFKTNTFCVLLNWLSGKLGLPDYSHSVYNPPRWVNGYDLGNCATTFYAFLYDGGFVQLVICSILMAIICQAFVLRIPKTAKQSEPLSVIILSYGYVIFTCLFSFFSNKFYEMVFTNIYLFMVVHWVLIKVFIEKVHLKEFQDR